MTTNKAEEAVIEVSFLLVIIYAIIAAADHYCPEHRNAVDDFLSGDG